MDITYPKKGEAIDIPKDKVNIKTGTVVGGKCGDDATTAQVTGNATIDPPDETKGPKLTITGINDDADALEKTDGHVDGTVSVDPKKKTLTIKYKDATQGGGEKCIEIEITGITKTSETVAYGHILTEGFDTILSH